MRHEIDAPLTAEVVELACRYGRYGYRRITALLRQKGWLVNHKRIERIWRREGLKVPQRQPKRGRIWLNDGSCILTTRCALIAPLGTGHQHRKPLFHYHYGMGFTNEKELQFTQHESGPTSRGRSVSSGRLYKKLLSNECKRARFHVFNKYSKEIDNIAKPLEITLDMLNLGKVHGAAVAAHKPAHHLGW